MGAVVAGRRAVATSLFEVQNVSVDGGISGGHDRARRSDGSYQFGPGAGIEKDLL